MKQPSEASVKIIARWQWKPSFLYKKGQIDVGEGEWTLRNLCLSWLCFDVNVQVNTRPMVKPYIQFHRYFESEDRGDTYFYMKYKWFSIWVRRWGGWRVENRYRFPMKKTWFTRSRWYAWGFFVFRWMDWR